MSDSSAPARPSQVTLAGWIVVIGSIAVVFSSFEAMAGIRSLETRESVREFLSEPPGDALGLSVQAGVSWLHALTMVAAGSATATAILGGYALRRSRSARIGLTVAAVPLLLSGLFAGGFMPTVVAVASVMLWGQPARDWFAGRKPDREGARPTEAAAVTGRSDRLESSGTAGAPGAPTVTADPPSTEPQAWSGFGDPRSSGPERPGGRPVAVLVACTLTWIFSGITLAMTAASMILIAADRDLVLEQLYAQNPELAEQGLGEDMVVAVVHVTGALAITWAIAAIVLAVLAYRRVAWARIALMVSAGCAAVLSLVGAITSLSLIVLLLACTLTISSLLRPEVRAWYAARGARDDVRGAREDARGARDDRDRSRS